MKILAVWLLVAKLVACIALGSQFDHMPTKVQVALVKVKEAPEGRLEINTVCKF